MHALVYNIVVVNEMFILYVKTIKLINKELRIVTEQRVNLDLMVGYIRMKTHRSRLNAQSPNISLEFLQKKVGVFLQGYGITPLVSLLSCHCPRVCTLVL